MSAACTLLLAGTQVLRASPALQAVFAYLRGLHVCVRKPADVLVPEAPASLRLCLRGLCMWAGVCLCGCVGVCIWGGWGGGLGVGVGVGVWTSRAPPLTLVLSPPPLPVACLGVPPAGRAMLSLRDAAWRACCSWSG
jgi:hypothetical protein